jgi:hypothetical protein
MDQNLQHGDPAQAPPVILIGAAQRVVLDLDSLQAALDAIDAEHPHDLIARILAKQALATGPIFAMARKPPAALPPGLVAQGLTREQAAAYVGLSTSAFDRAVKDEIYPGSTLPGGRYSVALIDAAIAVLNRKSKFGAALPPHDLNGLARDEPNPWDDVLQ